MLTSDTVAGGNCVQKSLAFLSYVFCKFKTKWLDNEMHIFSQFLLLSYVTLCFKAYSMLCLDFDYLLCSFKNDYTHMLIFIDFHFKHDLCFILCFF